MSNPGPKVLFLDIETRPAKVYTWEMFKTNISPNMMIEPGGILCFGAKWGGEKDMFFFSDWEDGHDEMIKAAHGLMSEADAIVTYNGDKFDLPKLTGEFALAGLPPVPPVTSIDPLKTVKRFGLDYARLAFVGPLFNVGEKVKHEGFELWSKVLDGDDKAQKRMEVYCRQDVRLLERLYMRIRPYIKTHPHMGEVGSNTCGACGSDKLQKRGFRRTKAYQIQRLQCTSCGSWQDGTRKKV